MLLNNIVKRVNAKSFGETSYTYEDIYPYFQEAIDSLNSQLDIHRRIPDAPIDYDDSTEYTFLQDIYINNYIVTFIVVAIDNASLSITNRTQLYASQLDGYKIQLISDLYKWMPIKLQGGPASFDLTGHYSHDEKGIPNVKIWYDESKGGKLVQGKYTPPTKGIRWDNPYGTVVVHPKYENYIIKKGNNTIPYVFIPNTYFRRNYRNAVVNVTIYGYDDELGKEQEYAT